MTENDQSDPKGYGNIYTPHAGSMIIAVQREGGLASRTIVLSERRVKFLRLFLSRTGITLAVVAVVSWLFFGYEAARVPILTGQLKRMEHDAARMDTLEYTLTQLQKRYEQVQHLLGAAGPLSAQTSRPAPQPSAASVRSAPPPARTAAATPASTDSAARSTKDSAGVRHDSTKPVQAKPDSAASHPVPPDSGMGRAPVDSTPSRADTSGGHQALSDSTD